MDFVQGQACDLHDFVARVLAAQKNHLRARQVEEICQEFDAGGVGRALHWRRHQPNVQSVSGPADDRVAGSPWLDAERKSDVRPDNPLTGCG